MRSDKKQVLDDILEKHAYDILKRLSHEDAGISKRIEELALEYLNEVSPDDIASGIFQDLKLLDVEDVWKNSGRTRYGYVDPGELADEMFENALEPYVGELKKYQKLSMRQEAKLYCMGILKGLYMFEKKATTQFQDWAIDAPHETYKQILEDWRKKTGNHKHLKDMDKFIKENCPEWYKPNPEEE